MKAFDENELPWPTTRMKWVGTVSEPAIQTGPFGSKLHASDYVDEGIPLILIKNITENLGFETADIPNISDEDAERLSKYQLKPGDIVVSRVGTIGRVAIATNNQEGWMISGQTLRVRPNLQRWDPRYIGRLFKVPSLRAKVSVESKGSTRESINTDILGNLQIPHPPLKHQKNISDYLDEYVGKIYELNSLMEELLDLIEEKRLSFISQTVTKGLDSTCEMKHSGNNDLGKVPSHWESVRLKYILNSIEQGWSPKCGDRPAKQGEWGVLKAGAAKNGSFLEGENKALPPEKEPRPEYEVEEGDLLMNRASGSPELIGNVAYLGDVRPRLLLCDKLFRLHVREEIVHPAFISYSLRSHFLRHQITGAISGASGLANNIPQAKVKDLVLALPPLPEQQSIIEVIQSQESKLDSLRKQTKKGLDLLQEKREALITAAVTGQIDLTDWPPLDDQESLA